MAISAAAGLLALTGVQSALGQSYSGEATVININHISYPSTNPIVIADTGPLPNSGGNLSVSVASSNAYNGALTLQNASAAASGQNSASVSAASVQNLSLEFQDMTSGATHTLTVSSISANASATCTASGVSVSGSSQVAGLAIDGVSIAVSGAANQTINFGDFIVVLNEQSSFSDANGGEITVTALHVTEVGCMDALLVTASADINCSGCPPCVDPELGLGSAGSEGTVLELGPHQVSITGPAGGILGDVDIAPNGKLAMSGDEYITGTIRLGPGAQYQNSSHSTASVQYNADLSAQINDAYAAYANAVNLPCTQSYAKLDGSVTTITGNVGLNVICVGDVVLAGKQVYLTGPAGAKFIVKVSGKWAMTGGGNGPQIRAAGGVKPSDVLYVVIGTGEQVAFSGGGGGPGNNFKAIVDGTLLAPYRNIALSPGLVNGEVISGQDISIVSGSSVRCPACQ